jgi:branched-chain amino acid transport system ATP-binding protein
VLVQKIFEIIARLHQDGLSILLVEQNAAVALAASQYAYILENGEIVLQGASDILRQDDSVKRTYLGN